MSGWSGVTGAAGDTPAGTPAEAGGGTALKAGAVGFPTALASAVGLIMASPVILTATSGFGMGGWAFAVAMIIAFVMMQAQATTFSEAAAMLPTAGSVYDYLSWKPAASGRSPARSPRISSCVFAGTAETILSGIMALVNFESLNAAFEKHNSSWLVGVGLVVTFAITNIIGIKVFSKLEIVLTAGMWLSLMIFGILGRGRAGRASRRLVRRLGSRHVGAGRAVAGRDGDVHVRRLRVRHAARAGNEGAGQDDSARDGAGPRRRRDLHVPVRRGDPPWVANVPVSADGLTHLLDTPGAIPAFALQVLGPFGRIWFGIAFLCAGAATINTLMAGLPRILYGMAIDGAAALLRLPASALQDAGGRYRRRGDRADLHAWLINGNLDSILHLVLAATCAWGTAYLLVTASVVMLRIRRRTCRARTVRRCSRCRRSCRVSASSWRSGTSRRRA